MALEKPIIKAGVASSTTYDYQPRDFAVASSEVAKSFVATDRFQSPDFKISELVAQQAGISQLEDDAHQDKINALVLERLGQVQEKAYTEGYELGLVEGTEKSFQETKESLVAKMRDMELLLKRIEELKTRLLIDNEVELIRLVFLTASKIALRDLDGNPDVVKELLLSVLSETQANERVVVKLSAEDLLFFESLQERSKQPIESLERVRFVMDEAVQPGGCLIETEFGTVDATVEERVERTWLTLQGRMPRKDPGPTK